MKRTKSGWPEFDKDCLDEFWKMAESFDQKMKDLKYVKNHPQFYKDLTNRILSLSPSITLRINRSQYAFYDELGIDRPFCSFVFFKSNFSLNPMRLRIENVKDLECDIFNFAGKIYRMGGSFYTRFYNWDKKDLTIALEIARRSYLVKEKVSPAPFFQDLKHA